MHVNYDELAPDYINYRVPDARIAAMIHRHLAPESKVLNVGAGQGSYEPTDCDLIALEPSRESGVLRKATGYARGQRTANAK